MPDPRIKELLAQLHETLKRTDAIDDETLRLVRQLEADIDRLLDSENAADNADSLIAEAQTLQTRFAIEHPTADRFLREIIDLLAKVGI